MDIDFVIVTIMKTNWNSFKYPFILIRKIVLLNEIQFIVLAGLLVTTDSCKKDASENEVKFLATLNGASEVPANSSMATGTATLTYNNETKIFSIIVNFYGVTATGAHIHKGAPGIPGGVVFAFASPVTSPVNYTSVAIDSTQQADLNASLYYVNIHSSEYPSGEIRGQLIKQ